MPFRKRSHVLLMLLSALLPLAGCSGNDQPASSALSVPTAPTAVTGATGVSTTADSEKCHSVQFLASFEGFDDLDTINFALSGDLVGHLTARVDFEETYKYSGPKRFYRGTESWNGTGEWAITGGSVPGLSFQTAMTNRNLISAVAGAPAETWENIGSHRALSGVDKANLSYKGTAWGDPATDYHVEHRYHGVICP